MIIIESVENLKSISSLAGTGHVVTISKIDLIIIHVTGELECYLLPCSDLPQRDNYLHTISDQITCFCGDTTLQPVTSNFFAPKHLTLIKPENTMKNDAKLSLELPSEWLNKIKSAKKGTAWGVWLYTDPRVEEWEATDQEKKRIHDRMARSPRTEPESYGPPLILDEIPPWLRKRSLLTWTMLEVWFQQVKTITMTRMIKRADEWIEDEEEEVDGEFLGAWAAGQDRAFHRTEEGWVAKSAAGRAEVRLIFPWVAAANRAIPMQEAAELARKAEARKAKRRERRLKMGAPAVAPVPAEVPAEGETEWMFTDLPPLASYENDN